MTRTATGPWETTPGMTARLQELYAAPEHYTAKDIGKILTHEFRVLITRNSVIGKTHRLRMPVRIKPVVTGPRVRQHSPRARSPRPRLVTIERRQPRPDGALLTIYQLGFGDCKYPVSGNCPYLYCGAEQAEGRSYCQPHYDLTHLKPRMTWE